MISSHLSISPPVIAHRGVSGQAPENTRAAFLKAKECGIRWVELDVMLSADDQVVVIHDDTLDRTTNGSGKIRDFSYAELKKWDAGSWFHPQFAMESIPLLSDMLPFFSEQQLAVNIEIKASPGQELKTVQTVLDVIERDVTKTNPILFSSFSSRVLYYLRKHKRQYPLGFLMDEWDSDWQMSCDTFNCVSIHVNHLQLDQEKVKAMKATERVVFCYTVNDVSRARTLFSWGVDAIFSDCPKEIINYVSVL